MRPDGLCKGKGADAMATIKMVAERCGLSVAAVSKALNGQPGVSPEKAALVRRTAQDMGYFPNAAARTLRMNRSSNIGVLFKNRLAHEYFGEVLEAIREEAEFHHYDITFLSNHVDEATSYYEHAKRRQCDGVVVVQGDFEQSSVQRLVESEIPVVSIDHVYNGRTAILSDNVVSAQEIVRYLHDLGHTRIAFIHGENGNVTRQRVAGFYLGCRECGIEVPDEYVVAGNYHKTEIAREATRQLLACKERPTCILYPDDVSYLGGLAEIEEQGLSVPEDISCVGFDGILMCQYLRPSLTTFQQNAQEIGRKATAQLISAIEDPKYYIPQVISVSGRVQPGGTVRDLTK